MRTVLTMLAALLTVLFLTACSQEPPPAQEPAKTAVQPPQPASEPSRQMAEKADKELQETLGAVKQEAEKEAQTVEKEAAAIAEKAESVVSEAADQAKKDAGTAVSDLKAVLPAPSAPADQGPVTVVYEASMGRVSFDHAGHSGRLACSKCHPTDPPEKIAIDKELAHTLCKGCHKESDGTAPTACSGCHKK